MVNPPDNIKFSPPDNVNFSKDCSFYQLAVQMFLWLTSPPLPGYGGGSYVFDSPVFYEVSPSGGGRSPALVAKSSGQPSQIATVSISAVGPEGELVVFDDEGNRYGIVEVEGGSNPVIETDGQKVPIGRVEIGPGRMPVFLDTSGKTIKGTLTEIPTLRDIAGNVIVFATPPATINANGHLFFLDRSRKAIAAEPGEADRHRRVLMTQDNRLVYYLIQVNDVYAYFLTGQKNGKIPLTMFPSSPEDLSAVKTYAAKHRMTSFPDEKALIVELKSSWVELPVPIDYGDYITINAQVPDFDVLSDTLWQQKGLRYATLAMVGMHMAFSVKGHPELIWATFEHVSNAPNVPYRYWNNDAGSFGRWLFSSGGVGTANQARMVMDGDKIRAIAGKTIGPTDILRLSPWGTHMAEFARNPNTHVISINNNIQRQLAQGDVRKNYIFVGATWGMMIKQGSRHLANSTIETFVQPSNCLDCHDVNTNPLGGTNALGHGVGLSHIFGALSPLFQDP